MVCSVLLDSEGVDRCLADVTCAENQERSLCTIALTGCVYARSEKASQIDRTCAMSAALNYCERK